jgi:hypothetical protein
MEWVPDTLKWIAALARPDLTDPFFMIYRICYITLNARHIEDSK